MNPLLEENLRCFQEILFSDDQFKTDCERLAALDTSPAYVPSERLLNK